MKLCLPVLPSRTATNGAVASSSADDPIHDSTVKVVAAAAARATESMTSCPSLPGPVGGGGRCDRR